MMTTRIILSVMANVFCMVQELRLNSNSRQEIMYKAKLAGYQTVTGPMFPEKPNFIYKLDYCYLIPVWTDVSNNLRATYIVTDLEGLPLTNDHLREVKELLGT